MLLTSIKDYKLVYVSFPYDGEEEQIKQVEVLIQDIIANDKKNDKKNIIYFSPLKAFRWVKDIEEDDLLNWGLKILTTCDEIYVSPDYELSGNVNQEIAIAKILGIPITYL